MEMYSFDPRTAEISFLVGDESWSLVRPLAASRSAWPTTMSEMRRMRDSVLTHWSFTPANNWLYSDCICLASDSLPASAASLMSLLHSALHLVKKRLTRAPYPVLDLLSSPPLSATMRLLYARTAFRTT